MARFLRALAHHLYGIHFHVLVLVCSKRRRETKSRSGFLSCGNSDANAVSALTPRVPPVVGKPLEPRLAFSRMRLHPLVCLDDMLGKRRRSKDLGDKRIWNSAIGATMPPIDRESAECIVGPC